MRDERVALGGVVLRVRHVNAATRLEKSNAPVLVFLHDSLGCVETWRDFPQRLAGLTGLDAIVYDRRGYGQSSPFGHRRRTPNYLHDEAGVLVQLLHALGVARVILFGHSDGGSIALLAAAAQQQRGRGGVAIAGIVTEGAHVFVEEVTLNGIRDARAMLESTNLRERLARYHGANTDGMTAAWIDIWLSPAFRDWNIESCLPRIACPLLAIQGADDEYGTQAQIQAIVRGVGSHAQSLILPGCGHTPHRDAADVTLAVASGFLVSRCLL